MTDRSLPLWADDLRRRYLRGEASIFILHGNVYDSVLHGDEVMTLTDFLGSVLLKESKETIAVYNVATGVRFTKRGEGVLQLDDLLDGVESIRQTAVDTEKILNTMEVSS